MGKLLEKAVSEAARLPESDQEAIGAWLLAEIESERRWSELFERPGAALERMANEALEEHRQGLQLANGTRSVDARQRIIKAKSLDVASQSIF